MCTIDCGGGPQIFNLSLTNIAMCFLLDDLISTKEIVNLDRLLSIIVANFKVWRISCLELR